ncbi:hypothetical protein ABID16_000070 [Rhizobium aquaticum]|uniref:Uncharacterized protein n=1 Tax=Rhizobium aquaticum TaxID=1549636 RepID=A0ABV2IVG3_9HYPH
MRGGLEAGYAAEMNIRAGQLVQHNVTGRFGRVHSDADEDARFVRVLFQGDRRTSRCRPEELEPTHG